MDLCFLRIARCLHNLGSRKWRCSGHTSIIWVSLTELQTYGVVLDNFRAIFIYRTYGPFVQCANIRIKVKRTSLSRKQELHMKQTAQTEVNATMVIYCFDSNYLVITPFSTAPAHKYYCCYIYPCFALFALHNLRLCRYTMDCHALHRAIHRLCISVLCAQHNYIYYT